MITGAKATRRGFSKSSLAPNRLMNQGTLPMVVLYRCLRTTQVDLSCSAATADASCNPSRTARLACLGAGGETEKVSG